MRRRPRTLALGVWLAARGGAVSFGLVLAGLGAVAFVVAAVSMRHSHGPNSSELAALPFVASTALAWGAGVLIVFGGSMRAVARDREQGVVALARARGVTPSRYAVGRVGGLALVVATAIAGATLIASIAVLGSTGASARHARLIAGAVAYGLAFAATVTPVGMATLGGRSRSRGYLAFLAVLVLPELLSPWTVAQLPAGWHEVTSIPAALAAVRAGIGSLASNAGSLARALAALAAVSAVSFAVVVGRARQTAPGEMP
jgi:hypothetical protein